MKITKDLKDAINTKNTLNTKNTKELMRYNDYLRQKELAEGTIAIYSRQASNLLDYLDGKKITKEMMMAYKKYLISLNRKITTTNLCIAAINNYLKYAGYLECVLKSEKTMKNRSLENVVTIEEYRRMLSYAKESGREKYYFIMRVLVFTGIRISELSFLTVEVLEQGKFTVRNKGKTREVYIPEGLVKELNEYCKKQRIERNVIFRGNRQKPISRVAVYKMLIHLADMVGVKKEKAHPHSFRHLFAVTYMKQYSDLTELADIMGHSSLETTRIYTMTTAEEKRRRLNGLKF